MTAPVPLSRCLDALAGTRIPGGCDDCDAYQTVRRIGGAFVLDVHHDETCPFLTGATR